ncbi:MAG: 3-hydroxyacyl-CoA dehydrogenase NAD-binding domain-containing protein [Pseudomonadota bacterium]
MRAFDKSAPIANVGMGVMGAKVAWACARTGITTRVFDTDVAKAHAAKETALTWSTDKEKDFIAENLHICGTLESALEGVQLAFENVPERLELKTDVLAEIGRILAPGAYMGTNASALTCSPLAAASGRPDLFFNLNFADPRTSRLVELMTCEATLEETVIFAKNWARAIGMIPIWSRKEQLGYSFNRLWRVIKAEVLRQIDQGVTTPHDIDRAWMMAFGTTFGPCALMDKVGLHSVLAVEKIYIDASGDVEGQPPQTLLDYVERGDLGEVSGKGFYDYPSPAYERDNFMEETDDDAFS